MAPGGKAISNVQNSGLRVTERTVAVPWTMPGVCDVGGWRCEVCDQAVRGGGAGEPAETLVKKRTCEEALDGLRAALRSQPLD